MRLGKPKHRRIKEPFTYQPEEEEKKLSEKKNMKYFREATKKGEFYISYRVL